MERFRSGSGRGREIAGHVLLAVMMLGCVLVYSGERYSSVKASTSKPGDGAHAGRQYGRLPLYFVENVGQVHGGSDFYIHGRDKSIYFSQQGLTFALVNGGKRSVVKLDFVNANPHAKLEGVDRTEAVFSYFSGPARTWKGGVRSFSSLVYRDLWPGIDLEYSGTVDRMKYSFRLKPGADPSLIQLAYRGANTVTLDAQGELDIQTSSGSFKDAAPVSFQTEPRAAGAVKHQIEVATKYWIKTTSGRAVYGFQVADYDRSRELIIDPAVLIYSGFVGGAGDDAAYSIAVDSARNAYIAGTTSSPQMSFPVVAGPDLTYNGGSSDAFVAKINPAGTALIYCGYIGGAQSDQAQGVAVDSSGSAYVVGQTFSDQTTFPVATGPGLVFSTGGPDVFVTKLNAAGTALVYSGYIGGTSRDFGTGIAVDSLGNAYISGYTESSQQTGFPVVGGPDLTYNGGIDGFVAKVVPAGSSLAYCGYIGGTEDDYARGIAVDSAGSAYLTGDTASPEASFPVAIGPDLTFNLGLTDAFVSKVAANGSSLAYSGYIGGPGADVGQGIAIDSSGNAYVTGETNMVGFPIIGGPDPIFNGATDAFVTKVNAAGSAFVYSGLIGGTGIDRGFGISVDSAGSAYIVGETSSHQTSFPVVGGPQLETNGVLDAFVAKLNSPGSLLIYCGYVGGPGNDYGRGISTDSDGNAYVAGYTESTAGFPVVAGPDLSFNGGMTDAFAAKIERRADTTPPVIVVPGGIPRSQGSSGLTSLGFVSDVDTRPENIILALRNIPPELSVTNLTNLNGQAFANITTTCSTALGQYTFTLEAIDGAGLRSESPVTVEVIPNTPPVLGVYAETQIVMIGGGGTVTPNTAPTDNGSITGIVATAAGFAGTFSVNPTTGVVTVTNASPRGRYNVVLTATDNCGATSTRGFTLLVGSFSFVPALTLLNPAIVMAGTPGLQVTITGTGFAPDAVADFNTSPRPTQYVSSTQVIVTLTAEDLQFQRNAGIRVFNSPPGGGVSNALTLAIAGQATFVNGASFQGTSVASDSIASIFGTKLATSVASATDIPLPETLAGTTVVVRDSAGTSRNAGLFYASPFQLNVQIPPLTAVGAATAIITNSLGEVSLASFQVAVIAPGIFTQRSDGTGVAAGYVVRIRQDGSRTLEPIGRFDSVLGQWVPIPIDFGAETDVLVLVLAGTGIRNVPGGVVTVEIGRPEVSIAICRIRSRLCCTRSDQRGTLAKPQGQGRS